MLVTIDAYINYFEAHIVRGRLEEEGINTFIIHNNHISINWWIALALGYIKLQVHPSNIKKGKEVLKKIEDGEFSALLDDMFSEEEKLTCRKCKNSNIRFDYFSRNVALVFLLLYIPIPYSNATIRCSNCNHVWREKDTITYNGFFVSTIALIEFFILYHLGSAFVFIINWFDSRNIFVF